MKHKDKVKMARRLRTKVEIRANISPFQCEAWIKRKQAIKERVKRVIAKAKARAERRRKEKERLRKQNEKTKI